MDKYDRQIRLWGKHGQQKLQESKILMIGSESSGVEALKNLVLPGIGKYKIVDDKLVRKEDVEVNFFTEPDSVGKNRGEVVSQKLGQLNEEVQSEYLNMQIEEYIRDKIEEDIAYYDVVISNELSQDYQLLLSKLVVHKYQKVLIILYTVGLLGYLRIDCKQLYVIEANTFKATEDFKLYKGFQGLRVFCESLNLEKLDEYQFSHIPYIVILYQLLQKYKQSNNGLMPSTFQSKQDFQQTIIQNARNNFKNNISFQQAYNNSWKIYQDPSLLPDNLQFIFNFIQNHFNLIDINAKFWQFSLALKLFYEKFNELPINGSIPDMNSLTNYYLDLQKVYDQKFNQDKQIIKQNLDEICIKFNLKQQFEEKELDMWIKNCYDLQYIQYKNLQDELNEILLKDFNENDNYVWYLVIMGVMEFEIENKQKPLSDQYLELQKKVRNIIEKRLKKEQKMEVEMKYLKEACRYGNKKVHTCCAVVGGIAAQEIIKIITQQNVALKDTLIYDGVQTRLEVHEF